MKTQNNTITNKIRNDVLKSLEEIREHKVDEATELEQKFDKEKVTRSKINLAKRTTSFDEGK